MEEFKLYPSIDIVGGKALTSRSAINITLGITEEKTYLGEVFEVAELHFQSGAKWIHIVDLDAASGVGSNQRLIMDLVKHFSEKVQTQVCGGIRSNEILEQYILAGCSRVNISSMIFDKPKLCGKLLKKYGGKIAIALDVKLVNQEYKLATRGWNNLQGNLWTTLDWLDNSGCQRYVLTDVDRGGSLNHPNFSLLEQVLTKTSTPIISGGGLCSLDDIDRLYQIGIEGAVLGQLIHTQQHQLKRFLQYVQQNYKDEPTSNEVI
ncbi:1-(5-phosphoribosyl)-5-[(5-phosphoribosylamino)methylideneamino] imidazole-4-carboxamide isomerase [Vibrio cholerae]|nr:1-(5-phosphoribosyl)-5-[(5-phosphoribosylamino)methylideneamino] imidazole-4-carboxamide isomerase [Vibrio cholerae]EHB5526755.1 1-(5-phosphoribosyl)-5-[(5-phosphoribosylamino)methylideneamino] imidazole-4-carboxamide isomerase [Vibrio cholerae]EJL6501859.1 1-(5-phosphoribosyl)-5-[(5-phosphoribosylamino)methylideneamino] imidazole-4-carboxamide isomerase [Vibrio cholerae]EKF9264433.1 1-(5-phosphoribosyl)-5-[(5-phosphoribosylamino)methylideneamino] imidazole-4-carboxamide isomerase [Vibrio cho